MIDSDKDAAERSQIQDSLWKTRLCDPATGEIPENMRQRELEFTKSIPTREMLLQQKGSRLTAAEWEFRGPSNVSGRIRALAIDIDNESILLAGGVSGGLWRSVNEGQSWIRTSSLDEGISVTTIAQDIRPGKRNVWYYGTGEGVRIPLGEGIFKSQNGGTNWTLLPSTKTIDFQGIYKIVIDDKNQREDVLFAATRAGIYRSADGGQSWKIVLKRSDIPSQLPIVADIALSANGIFYAALAGNSNTPCLIYRSVDGITWASIGSRIPFLEGAASVKIATYPTSGNAVYVCMSNSKAPLYHSLAKYTYLSGDGTQTGGVWEDKTSFLPNGFQTYGGYAMALKIHPTNSNTIFFGGVSNYFSTDGFSSTGGTKSLNVSSMSDNQRSIDNHDYIFSYRDPAKMYIISDQGIHVTTNSLSAQSFPFLPASELFLNTYTLNQSLNITQFYSVAIDRNSPGNVLIAGGTQDRGSYLGGNLETNWQKTTGGDGFAGALSNNGRTLYSSSQGGDIYRDTIDASGKVSNESSLNYLFQNISPAAKTTPPSTTQFILDPQNDNIMYYITYDSLWVHRNLYSILKLPWGGTSGTPLSPYNRRDGWQVYGIPPLVVQNFRYAGSISTIAASRTKNFPTRLYIGTQSGVVYRIDNPQEPALSISLATPLLPNAAGNISSLVVDSQNPDRVLATVSNFNVQSIFLTEDAGKTWKAVGGNLEQFANGTGGGPAVLCAEILYADNIPIYFIGTSAGLYSTPILNGMNTVWMKEASTSIGSSPVVALASRDSDGLLVAATFGNGIFSANFGSTPRIRPLPPIIATLPDITTKPTVPLVFPISVSDADTSSLAVDVQQSSALSYRLNYFVSGTGGKRTAKIIPFPNAMGEAIVTVSAMNKFGISAQQKFKWIVTNSTSTAVDAPNSSLELGSMRLDIFPNPFVQRVFIRYVTFKSSLSRIVIRSVSGQEVFATPFQMQSAGEHEIVWEGQMNNYQMAPAGLYFCTFERVDDNGRKEIKTQALHYLR